MEHKYDPTCNCTTCRNITRELEKLSKMDLMRLVQRLREKLEKTK